MKYLAACCIFKDELRYLREWLEYHRLVGVEHFYLVSNDDSPEPSRRLLAPYIDAGLATFWHHPGGPFVTLQTTIYLDAVVAAMGKARWLAFLDADEFLLPVKAQSLPAVLKDYESYPGLAVNSACFGSSGLRTPPPLQTEAYRLRLPDDHFQNRAYKSLVDPTRTIGVTSPHQLIHTGDDVPVDEWGRRVRDPIRNLNVPFFGERLRVNHYRTRSAQEFAAKLERWKSGGHPELAQAASAQRMWDTVDSGHVPDETIQRFVPELKRRLG
jgi:hypothetical protein